MARLWLLCAMLLELFMCHKHEMMDHFYSKTGRSHASLNPARRDASIPTEIRMPDDVIIFHDDDILDERKIIHGDAKMPDSLFRRNVQKRLNIFQVWDRLSWATVISL